MMKLYKNCEQCGNEFNKPYHRSIAHWGKARFCSPECHNIFRMGKPSPSPETAFKKGHNTIVGKTLRGELNHKWKGGQIEKVCEICKIVFKVDPYRKDAKTCSIVCRKKYFATEKFRESQSKIHREKITPKEVSLTKLMRLIRKSYLYNIWRDKVHKKYNYTCQICGKRGGKLQADHNEPYLLLFKKHNIDTYEKAIACIELWNVNNGKTLCVKCHRESDTYGSKVHNAIAKLIN